jgi:GNAT superfamily N-acetyltransferase
MEGKPAHNPIAEVIFRDLLDSDIESLAQLHAKAWRQTYEPFFGSSYHFPTAELRKQQWEQKFASKSDDWFCIVAELNGQLIGFTCGNSYSAKELRQFDGELNKLYLLREYQGFGIGKKIFLETFDRFRKNGISAIVAFTEPQNPTGKFFEHMGGKKITGEKNIFLGAYGWFDLQKAGKL